MLVIVVHSFLFFILFLFFICCLFFIYFHATLPCYQHSTPPLLVRPWRPPPALRSRSTPTTFNCLFFFIYRERYGFEWAFFIHRRFLPYDPSSTFKARLQRPPWKPEVLPWSFQGFMLILETQTRPIYFFDWQQFTIFIFRRIHFKFYQTLSWIACGESLVYPLLTRFELFSLVQGRT